MQKRLTAVDAGTSAAASLLLGVLSLTMLGKGSDPGADDLGAVDPESWRGVLVEAARGCEPADSSDSTAPPSICIQVIHFNCCDSNAGSFSCF